MNEKNSYANDTRLPVSRPPRNQFEIKSKIRKTVVNGKFNSPPTKRRALKLTFKQIITNNDVMLLMCWCIHDRVCLMKQKSNFIMVFPKKTIMWGGSEWWWARFLEEERKKQGSLLTQNVV